MKLLDRVQQIIEIRVGEKHRQTDSRYRLGDLRERMYRRVRERDTAYITRREKGRMRERMYIKVRTKERSCTK